MRAVGAGKHACEIVIPQGSGHHHTELTPVSLRADGCEVVAITVGSQVWPVGLAAVAVCAVSGWLVAFRSRRRRVRSESMLVRHREMSLDLICTASFDGHFVDVN